MGAALEKEREIGADALDLARQTLTGERSPSVPQDNLSKASFSSRGNAGVTLPAEETVGTTFLAIFNQEVVRKMWLSAQGAHVTLSEGTNGEHILRVIDTRTEPKGVVSQLNFDQKPSISVAPGGQSFIIATDEMATEYAIGKSGTLTARPVYLASEGQQITGARYRGDEVVISSRPLALAV